ncbi:hypothetical protein FB451DRAFT_951597, partial [Mycena latifolia]
YFAGTKELNRFIGVVLHAVFPEFWMLYTKAFAAGQVHQDDEGPYLGRAVVHKLQVYPHRDGLDAGPGIATPCGYYKGGAMLFSDIGAKFQYSPGDLCAARFNVLYHAVSPWQPTTVPTELSAKQITPGRISTVFFTPEKALLVLKEHLPGWMRRTVGG